MILEEEEIHISDGCLMSYSGYVGFLSYEVLKESLFVP